MLPEEKPYLKLFRDLIAFVIFIQLISLINLCDYVIYLLVN